MKIAMENMWSAQSGCPFLSPRKAHTDQPWKRRVILQSYMEVPVSLSQELQWTTEGTVSFHRIHLPDLGEALPLCVSTAAKPYLPVMLSRVHTHSQGIAQND